MYSLPTSIQIGEKQFNITNKGDFRMVLDCFNALNDEELEENEQVVAALLIFYEDIKDIDDLFVQFDTDELLAEAIQSMFLFFNCGQEHVGMETDYELVDWNKDEQIIVAAINTVANKEVRLEEYIHWWTFMGYYSAIGECPLNTIISIRDKLMRGKKLEQHEREFRQQNPQYFVWDSSTTEDKEAEALFNELWNQGD